MLIQDFSEFSGKNTSSEETKTEPMDMVLQGVGMGEFVHYAFNGSSTERVRWVSSETDPEGNPVKVRIPAPVTTIFGRNEELTVAGKTYPCFRYFLKERSGEWVEDMYGRKVFCMEERFPCFDSYDYLHENRYYRWYFIREGNSITRVFSADECDKIYVTEDVQDVDSQAWKIMKNVGFCQRPEG